MQPKFKSFDEAFSAKPQPLPKAANDNRQADKPKRRAPRYRGTLPALRWLFDHDPALAKAVAEALPKAESDWSPEAVDNGQEIRPTVGELMREASDAFRFYVRDGVRHVATAALVMGGKDYRDDWWYYVGNLKFYRGRLTEWSVTKKSKRLRPVDRITGQSNSHSRSVRTYLATKPTISSPLHATSLPRPFSGEPALPPMLDPLDGVERNREILAEAYRNSPGVQITRCPMVVAKGATFIGGISKSKGTTSSGAVGVWEGPAMREGEVGAVLEEVAARGTLRSIGERLGFNGDYADRAGKRALLEAARVLVAANDNSKKKVAA